MKSRLVLPSVPTNSIFRIENVFHSIKLIPKILIRSLSGTDAVIAPAISLEKEEIFVRRQSGTGAPSGPV
ncbi:hypothetical protein [Stappia sp. ES.058]|uniref:hypothetical protein n=1 Tax=Stappia sp. ES.058 TaxID=1881061 RepID=UPI0012FDFBBB|nr:hypothetical protein [Stappia sp. ES.058]